MKTYITSDLHLFHKTTLKWNMRKRFNSQSDIDTELYDKSIFYNDMINMNETIINNWNTIVGKDDLVYNLGDLSFGAPWQTREIIERLNGKMHLILGNHDKMKAVKKYMDLLEGVDYYKEIQYPFDGKKYHIIMMHYPIQQWNRKNYNSIMLCGHSHGMLEHEVKEQHIKYDVGIDTELANFYPILIDDIIIKTREIIPKF